MVSEAEVKKVAKLAKLKIKEQDIQHTAKQFISIVHMIDQLHSVNCDSVEPLSSVHEMNLRMSEDVVSEGNIEDQIFRNAPGNNADLAKEIKYFVVPKVIE